MIYTTRFITKAAVIAVLYAAVTMLLMPISYGLVQFRVSEAFMLLAALTPSAIPGLFVGCILANFFGGFGFVDIAFGSIATLLAAYITYFMSSRISGLDRSDDSPQRSRAGVLKVLLLPLPTIIFNGLIVGGYLPFIIPEIRGMASNLYLVLVMCIGSVMLGEAVVTYAIGIPLYYGIRRTGIFRHDLNEQPKGRRTDRNE
ncbi:MAG: QueT transporter family protein [Saccharofermentanales bacterium]